MAAPNILSATSIYGKQYGNALDTTTTTSLLANGSSSNKLLKIKSEIINKMELHSAFLFFGYGVFMSGIAYFATTEHWLFFKTIGFYIIFSIFMIVEFFLIRLSIKKMISNKKNGSIK